MSRNASLISILMFATGCSSAIKRADLLFEKEAYEEAEAAYHTILGKTPDHAEALAGLKATRRALIDTKLIEVRSLRLAGSEQDALNRLTDLVKKEKDWGVGPTGAAAYTQSEECAFAYELVATKVKALLDRRLPLAAEVLFNEHVELFDGAMIGRANRLSATIKNAGQSQCRHFRSGMKAGAQPFYEFFVAQFCSHFGEPPRDVARPTRPRGSELFGRLVPRVAVDGISPELRSWIEIAITDAFRRSPWYDANGAHTATLNVAGHFERAESSREIKRVHEYTEQVPYTKYEPVERSKEVPYSASERKCKPTYDKGVVGETCTEIPVTKYRTEYYTETEARTAYRAVPRTFEYSAQERQQVLTFGLSGQLELKKISLPVSFAEKSSVSGFEHAHRLPKIGLEPESAKLPDPLDWTKEQTEKLAISLTAQLRARWDDLFCKPSSKGLTAAEGGDLVHRCLKSTLGSPPVFAENWYQQTVGVSVGTAANLLSLNGI